MFGWLLYRKSNSVKSFHEIISPNCWLVEYLCTEDCVSCTYHWNHKKSQMNWLETRMDCIKHSLSVIWHNQAPSFSMNYQNTAYKKWSKLSLSGSSPFNHQCMCLNNNANKDEAIKQHFLIPGLLLHDDDNDRTFSNAHSLSALEKRELLLVIS